MNYHTGNLMRLLMVILALALVSGTIGCNIPGLSTTEKTPTAADYFARGMDYYEQEQYDLALADFNEAIELEPDYAAAYKSRGDVYDARGEYDQAILDYSKAIELDSAYSAAYNNRGNTYYSMGQYVEAVGDFSKAIELDPSFDKAYSNRGYIYSKEGMRVQAIADYDKVVELTTDPVLLQEAQGMLEELCQIKLDVPNLVVPPDTAITCTFNWSYGRFEWTWEAQISNELYQILHNRPRPRTDDNSVYVTDTLDDAFFRELASALITESEDLGYTREQMMELAITFVQALPYTYDIDTTGLEEYARYPIETLVFGSGDCEDTAFLLAELLRDMGFEPILLYYQGLHTAVGVADIGSLSGTYYEWNGKKYFYIESTGEGWKIGELPDGYGAAEVWELVPFAVVGCESYVWPAWSGTLPLEVTVYNDGVITAENVQIWAKLDAGNNTHWSEDEITVDIPPGETRTVTLHLDAPGQPVYTRVVVRINYGGYMVDEETSEWFNIY